MNYICELCGALKITDVSLPIAGCPRFKKNCEVDCKLYKKTMRPGGAVLPVGLKVSDAHHKPSFHHPDLL